MCFVSRRNLRLARGVSKNFSFSAWNPKRGLFLQGVHRDEDGENGSALLAILSKHWGQLSQLTFLELSFADLAIVQVNFTVGPTRWVRTVGNDDRCNTP